MPRRSQRKLILGGAALLLVAGLLGLWWSLSPARNSGAAIGTEAGVQEPRVRDAELERGVAAVPDAAQETGAQRSAAQGMFVKLEQRQAAGLPVLVVDARTRAPVADASVCWMFPSGHDFEPYGGLDLRGMEILARERGCERRTNTDGVATLPVRNDDGVVVSARAGERFGFCRQPYGMSGAVVVAVAPERAIDVRVVDEAREPLAGIRVALEHWTNGEIRLARGVSDAKGEVRLEGIDAAVAFAEQGEVSMWAVRAVVRCAPVIERWVDLAAPKLEPVELVVPALATLRARVVDVQGNLVPIDGRLLAHVEGTAWPSVNMSFGQSNEDATPFVRGVAELQQVAVGQTLQLGVDFNGEAELYQTVRGPTQAGEVLEVALHFEQELVVLEARAVDEAGTPLARRKLSMFRRRLTDTPAADTFGGPDSVETDAHGFLRWLSPLDFTEVSAGSTSAAEVLLQTEGPPAQMLEARVHEQGARPAGTQALGDIVFRPRAPLLAGTVVDTAGAPLVGVGLWIESGTQDYVPGVLPGFSDAQGRFAIYGFDVAPEYILHPTDGDYFLVEADAARRIARGTRDVVLHAVCLARLEGELLVDAGVDVQKLRIDLEDSDHVLRAASVAPLFERASFEFFGVAAGPATLRVVDENENTVAEVQHLMLQAGHVTRDPRVLPLDLRGKLAAAPVPAQGGPSSVRVVDASGRTPERGLAWVGDANETALPWTAGTLRLAWPQTSEITVWSAGSRLTRGPVPPAGGTFQLQPALYVTVQVDLPEALRAHHRLFVVSFVPIEPLAPEAESLRGQAGEWSAFLDENSTCTVELGCGGTFDVVVRATLEDSGSYEATFLGATPVEDGKFLRLEAFEGFWNEIAGALGVELEQR
jgi:hypothetical protein